MADYFRKDQEEKSKVNNNKDNLENIVEAAEIGFDALENDQEKERLSNHAASERAGFTNEISGGKLIDNLDNYAANSLNYPYYQINEDQEKNED